MSIIDLDKYNKSIKTIVPILNGKFKYNGKKYNCNTNNSGWFNVEIQGNNSKIISNIIITNKNNFSLIKGYVLNDQFIFFNFDEGRRKVGKKIITDVYFNTCPSFSSIIAILWEDNNLYYYSPNYRDSFIYTVKQIMENNSEVIKNVKGLTPELRTLCLFYELEKQRLEELKTERENEKLRKTLHGRLILSFRRVGAELLKYSIAGNRIVVDWNIDNQEFNSVLDKNSFRVIEAGYCMSGQDNLHSVHSLVILAKDYDKDGLIYKTRE